VSLLPGFAKLLSGKPHHPVGADGKMALSDHLRELRARILKSALAVLVLFVVALLFFDQLYEIVYDPYQQAQAKLPEGTTMPTTGGAAGGFLLYFKLCGLAALICASPFWLYQIWAFILPGLHPRERKWSRVFTAIAGPLFIIGVTIGYLTLPKGLEILIGFNPEGVTNLVEFNEYLTFFSRTLLAFGIAFEIPLFVVLLNLAGVVKGASIGAHRAWIIIGTFVFAAVITPSGDPFTMSFMALPMLLLFGVSEVIARWNDRRRERKNPYAGLSPDEASTL
jgi:sec-independent protein translocase protein TatC